MTQQAESGPEIMERSRNIELVALLEVSKALSSTTPIERRLFAAVRILAEYLDLQRGTITLRDMRTGELNIAAAYGLSRTEIARGKYKIGEGIIGKVVRSGSPIVIPNVDEEPLFLNRTESRNGITKQDISFLCVPIKDKGDILGVLSVDRIFGSRVTYEEDLRVMKLVAQLIAQTLRLERLLDQEREEKEELRQQLKDKYRLGTLIGSSKGMQDVFRMVHKVAPSRTTVLLRGESGTGKELIARAIYSLSERSAKPFVKINCAAVPGTLLESEFFGHEKGAFTGAIATRRGKFEEADGGTVFLDEIGDLELSLQAKLLRVLQEREFERVGGNRTIRVDVRLIAATNRNLEDAIREGTFREDLYYRLNVVPVFLPPLRERFEDIPLLIDHFLDRFNRENERKVVLQKDAVGTLTRYTWPGNVRELENAIENTVVLAETDKIRSTDLPAHILSGPQQPADGLKGSVEQLEKDRIRDALAANAWIYARAARALGLTERQLVYRVKKYGLSRE